MLIEELYEKLKDLRINEIDETQLKGKVIISVDSDDQEIEIKHIFFDGENLKFII